MNSSDMNVGSDVWMVSEGDQILVGQILGLDDDDSERVMCRWANAPGLSNESVDVLHPADTIVSNGATYLRV